MGARAQALLLAAFTVAACACSDLPAPDASGDDQPGAPGRVVYVSPSGESGSTGATRNAPTTLAAALATAGEMLASGEQGHLVISLLPGEYPVQEPLRFEGRPPGRAGQAIGATITLRAETPDTAVISGGGHVDGPWERGRSGAGWTEWRTVLAADARPFRNLFWRNVRLTRAREPNTGYLRIVEAQLSPEGGRQYTVAADIIRPRPLAFVQSEEETRVEIVARYRWMEHRQEVWRLEARRDEAGHRGNDFGTAVMAPDRPLGIPPSLPYPFAGCPGPWPASSAEAADEARFMLVGVRGMRDDYPCGTPRDVAPRSAGVAPENRAAEVYFENSAAYLDATFEWFLDESTPGGRALSVLLPTLSGGPKAGEVVAPRAPALVSAEGVHGLRLEGLIFAYTDPGPPMGGYGAASPSRAPERGRPGYAPASGGCVDGLAQPVIPAAVELFRCSGCRVSRCRIAHAGGGGVYIFGDGNEVDGSELFDLSGIGVFLGRFTPPGQRVPAVVPVDGNAITRNLIHHFGVEYRDCPAVEGRACRRTVISNNDIAGWTLSGPDIPESMRGGGWSGIVIGFEQSQARGLYENNTVSQNRVRRVMTTLVDGGGIYVNSGQPGSLMERNHVLEIVRDRTNLAEGFCIGVYFDQGSSGWHVRSNLVESLSDFDFRPHFRRPWPGYAVYFNDSASFCAPLPPACASFQKWEAGAGRNFVPGGLPGTFGAMDRGAALPGPGMETLCRECAPLQSWEGFGDLASAPRSSLRSIRESAGPGKECAYLYAASPVRPR